MLIVRVIDCYCAFVCLDIMISGMVCDPQAVTKCFGQLADKEPKNFIVDITQAISAQLTSLSSSINDFWEAMKTKPTLPKSSGTTGALDCYDMDDDRYYISSDFFLHHFLTTVSGVPLQDCCANDTLSPEMNSFAIVLQKIMVLNYIVEGFAAAVQLVQSRPSMRSSLSVLSQNKAYTILKRLTEEVYIGSQQELCRYVYGCVIPLAYWCVLSLGLEEHCQKPRNPRKPNFTRRIAFWSYQTSQCQCETRRRRLARDYIS